MKKILQDFSLSTFVAGLVAVLVGYTSSAVIVFQAATSSGVSNADAGSWLGIICVAMGLLTVYLSLKHKMPIMFAWSTAGGAILITSVAGLALNEIIGTFVFSAFLIFLCGITGFFKRVMNKIPVALASAMLAGVLLHFALEVFVSMKTQMTLSLSMFVCYLFGRRFFPRFNIVIVLILGMMIAWLSNLLNFSPVDVSLLKPVFTMPAFKFSSLMSVGIPLFVVTMASQNLTGVTVMRTYGYRANVSELISWSGFVNLIIAPFGGYTINLSALTAAICMGPEAHFDHERRYTAAVASGVIYVILGLFSGIVVSLFAAFPKELIMTIAGLAMMNTVANGLVSVVEHIEDREPAMITFFVTASGISLFGIGAAFWGLVAGGIALFIFRYKGRA